MSMNKCCICDDPISHLQEVVEIPGCKMCHRDCLDDAITGYRLTEYYQCPNGCGKFDVGMDGYGVCKCGFNYRTTPWAG